MNSQDQATTASWINVIAAGWLILSPFFLGFALPLQTNEFWVGVVVAVVALVRAFSPSRNVWLSWINAIAGVWLVFSPFVFGYISGIAIANAVIVGAIIGMDAIWNIAAGSAASHHRQAQI